jgi:hypothetical protein
LFFDVYRIVDTRREPKKTVSVDKPCIYVTRTDHIFTFESEELWILEYVINGIYQSPVFDSLKVMNEYREYLDTIGKAYHKENNNAAK